MNDRRAPIRICDDPLPPVTADEYRVGGNGEPIADAPDRRPIASSEFMAQMAEPPGPVETCDECGDQLSAGWCESCVIAGR